MEDKQIVELYWQRNERAITETSGKYGKLCLNIADNILNNTEDARECVNDTYLAAWNSMPKNRPEILSAFLAKITRRISISKWRKNTAEKRGGDQLTLALSELEECVPSGAGVENEILRRELVNIIDRLIMSLPNTERDVFVCRYFYLDSIKKISEQMGFSQSKIKSMLYRTRKKLARLLEKEGISHDS